MAKRIGIVGCGLIADTHVEAIKAVEPTAEIYVADPLPGKAELFRRRYNLKASFHDETTLLSEVHPFSVHVLSPPQYHVQHVQRCLEAGANVLVEKPFCFDLEQARKLYELASDARVVLCVDHSLLFQPAVMRMRQLLKRAGNAVPLSIDCFYGLESDYSDANKLPDTHWKRTLPGGILVDALVHPMSLAVFLSGRPLALNVTKLDACGSEQLRVTWKAANTLVCITVSRGIQPFRRVTFVAAKDFLCTIDHSTEVLAVQETVFGPRSLRKLYNNLSLAWQLEFGTLNTAWKFARGKIRQNPGARALIAAYYEHLAGRCENPVPPDSVLDTTFALQRTVAFLTRETEHGHSTESLTRNTIEIRNPLRTVLVTGASGFLGRTLCRKLLETGEFRIIAQVRRSPNADKLPAHTHIRKLYADFDHFTQDDFNRLVQGVDDVVHCAHAARAKTWADYERRNVQHSLALYDASATAGCKHFIHVSSLAVYGMSCRADKMVDEKVPVAKGGIWEFYIRSKILAEEGLLARAANGHPQLLILRPGILYSAEGERLFSRSFITRGGRIFLLIGSGRNHLPYTRVDVLAELITGVLQRESFPTGIYNVCGDQSESVQEFLARRCEKLGMQCRFLRIPAVLLWVAAFGLEALYWITRQQRAPKLTRYVVNSATRDLRYDCTKAMRELGWDPRLAVAP